MTVSVASTITTADYNTILETISGILNPTIGGYGAEIRESTTATNNMVGTYAHWNALYTDVNKSIRHQTGADIANVEPPVFGNLITAAFVNSLAAAAELAVANSQTVHASQLTSYTSATSFTTVAWDEPVTSLRTYTWNSDLEANYFFNLGGSLTTNIGSSGTVATLEDQAFTEFVAQANSPYSTLALVYDRNWWLNTGTTTVSYSTVTTTGNLIFTATVAYTKTADAVQINSTIVPPAGRPAINIVPMSSATLISSYNAIVAPLPSSVTDRKFLTVSGLAPFVFNAGKRSEPQLMTLYNSSAEPITVDRIEAVNNSNVSLLGFVVSTATDVANPLSPIVPFTTATIASNESISAVVYYYEPSQLSTGTFYNALRIVSDEDADARIVNTEQTVLAPAFDFNLRLVDFSQEYTYANWQNEFNLTDAEKNLGVQIATTYYLSSSSFGIVNGRSRYGLYRKPDANGLAFWVKYTNSTLGGVYTGQQFINAFFGGMDAGNSDLRRSLTPYNYFDPGYGYGNFYDKTLVDTDINGGLYKTYNYEIQPLFGSINANVIPGIDPGYSVTLSNQEFDGAPSSEAVSAFNAGVSFTQGDRITRGPYVQFLPTLVTNTGSYSTDVTVSVRGIDLNGVASTVTKTTNLSLTLNTLSDGNLVQWVSGYEENNAVMGMSYDRINGQLYLTVGIGSGGDGAPTLAQVGYASSYVGVGTGYLGIGADSKWGTFNPSFGLPMYKISYPNSWGNFMNTYAVWPCNPSSDSRGSWPQNMYIIRNYEFTAPVSGTYRLELAADDEGLLSIDGVPRLEGNNSYRGSVTTTVELTQGLHTVTLNFRNSYIYTTGNPGGIAVTIASVSSGQLVWSTLDTVRQTAPYPYWAEVYRIPIKANEARTYFLGHHLVKNNFPVDQMPVGAYTYGRFFGTVAPGSQEVGSIMTVDSDGKGNLTFNWIPQGTAITGPDAATIAGITRLPYYYSYLPSRKRNLTDPPGATTLKLIGMTTKGVKTVPVPTLGYGKIAVSVIDESGEPSSSTLQSNWNTYVSNNPGSKFFLLQPGASANAALLRVPTNFNSTIGIGPIRVNRDEGITGARSDWFELCGLGSYLPGTQVTLLIDNSGSMTTNTVDASFDYFLERCTAAGFYVTFRVGYDENWISQFNN